MKRKLLAGVLCLALVLCLLPAAGTAAPITGEPLQQTPGAIAAAEKRAAPMKLKAAPAAGEEEHTSGLLYGNLSKERIKSLLQDSPVDFTQEVFLEKPSADGAPYTAGALTPQVKQAALNRLNALRAIAGLYPVLPDEGLNEMSQYGAVICAGMGDISHHPSSLPGMDPWFYRQAFTSTSSSNLAAGVSCVEAVDMFMEDRGNDYTLGHRRWQLNPDMGKTGFGYAESSVVGPSGWSYRQYTTQYSFNSTNPIPYRYDFIGWPASGNFPMGKKYSSWDAPDPLHNMSFLPSTIWSVTLNPEKYMAPDINTVQVSLTRERDGHTWVMNQGNSGTGGRFFYVNNRNYGVPSCIMFRPAAEEQYDGLYTVRIDGLRNNLGDPLPTFRYSVDFFDPSDPNLGYRFPPDQQDFSLYLTDCLALRGGMAVTSLVAGPGYFVPEGKIGLTRYQDRWHMNDPVVRELGMLGVKPAPGFTGTVTWDPVRSELSWSGGDPSYAGPIALCYLENAADGAVIDPSGNLYYHWKQVRMHPCEIHTFDGDDITAPALNYSQTSVSLALQRASARTEDAQRLLAVYDGMGQMTELQQIPAAWGETETSRYVTLPVERFPVGGTVSLFTVDPESQTPVGPAASNRI